jgi:acylphosphatase
VTQDGIARLDAEVRGRVQGVGFRYFVLDWATQLNLSGWVANTADGAVRCVAEGPRDQLELLVERLREGPRGARVDDLAVMWAAPSRSFDRFSVRSMSHAGD